MPRLVSSLFICEGPLVAKQGRGPRAMKLVHRALIQQWLSSRPGWIDCLRVLRV